MKVAEELTISGPPSTQDTFVGRHICKERESCPPLPGREVASGHVEFGEDVGQGTSGRAKKIVPAPGE